MYRGDIDHVSTVFEVLRITLRLQGIRKDPHVLSPEESVHDFRNCSLAIILGELGMHRQSIALRTTLVHIYRILAPGNLREYFPTLALNLEGISQSYVFISEFDLALKASEDAVSSLRLLRDTYPDFDTRILLANALGHHARNLASVGRSVEAIQIAQESTGIYVPWSREHGNLTSSSRRKGHLNPSVILSKEKLSTLHTRCIINFLDLARYLFAEMRQSEACAAARQAIQTVHLLPSSDAKDMLLHSKIFEHLIYLSSGYRSQSRSFPLIEDIIIAYHDLAQLHPDKFVIYFLQSLQAYEGLSNAMPSDYYIFTAQVPLLRRPRWMVEMYRPDRLDGHCGVIPDNFKHFLRLEKASRVTRDAVYYTYYRHQVNHSEGTFPSVVVLTQYRPLAERMFESQVEEGLPALREIANSLLNSVDDDHCEVLSLRSLKLLNYFLGDLSCLAIGLPEERIHKILSISEIVVQVHLNVLCNDRWKCSSDRRGYIAGISEGFGYHFWCLFGCQKYLEALDIAQKSFDILQSVHSDTDLERHMAYTLYCLSFASFHLKNTAKALAFSRKVLEFQRKFKSVNDGPRFFNLLNMHHFLSFSGQQLEALAVIEEAASKREHDTYLKRICLTRLACSYLIQGRVDEALAVSREAVENSRDLETIGSPGVRDNLSRSLHAFSNCLAKMGREEEALIAIEEAVATWRSWPRKHPMGFGQHQYIAYEDIDLLHNFSIRLVAAGRSEEALSAIEEATSRCRILTSACPVYLPQLPKSLRTLATQLWSFDRREESIAFSKEAIEIWRPMVSTPTEAYLAPLYCELLDELALRLADLERLSESDNLRSEATRIRATIPQEQSEIRTSREESIINSKEAIEIWRPVIMTPTKAYPAPQYYHELLDEVALRRTEMGQPSEADDLRAEATNIRATIPIPQERAVEVESDATSAEKAGLAAAPVIVQSSVVNGNGSAELGEVAGITIRGDGGTAQESDAESIEKTLIPADDMEVQPPVVAHEVELLEGLDRRDENSNRDDDTDTDELKVAEGSPLASTPQSTSQTICDDNRQVGTEGLDDSPEGSPDKTTATPSRKDEVEQPMERLDEHQSSVQASKPSALPTSPLTSSDLVKKPPSRGIPTTIRQTITFLAECAAVVWLFMTAWNYLQSPFRNLTITEEHLLH